MAISDAINRMMIRTVSVDTEDYMRQQPHRRTSFTHHVRVRLAETTDSSDLSLSGTVNNTNDSEYFTDDGTGGDGSFTAGTIVSLLLCVLIIVIFLWLGYCACWFSYGGPIDDEEDEDENRKHGLTTEERKQYLERVLICKKYVLPEAEVVPTNFTKDGIHEESMDNLNVKRDSSSDEISHHQVEPIQNQQAELHSYISPQCAICLETFLEGDMVFESSSVNAECKHEFHQNCIHQWCMVQTNCPCCRRELLFAANHSILGDDEDDDDRTAPNDSFRSAP